VLSAVIFDFDGVIADTEGLHLRAFQEVFGARGWTLRESVYFDRYLGYDDEGLVAAFATDEALGLPASELESLVAAKGRVFARYLETGDVLFPDARACIDRLAAHYPLGIASGALKGEILHILAAGDILERFPVIVSAEDVRACKPDPEPYLTAARQLGVAPAACLAIEDSPPGLAAARAAGMRTIGITTTTTRDQLRADRVVDRLAEVTFELLANIGPTGPNDRHP
jgi:beta-phosphoglucomutase